MEEAVSAPPNHEPAPLPAGSPQAGRERLRIDAKHLLMLFTAAGVLAGVVDDVVRATPNMPADGALVDGGLVAVDAAGMTTGISAALGEAMQEASELLAPLLESLTEVKVECPVE